MFRKIIIILLILFVNINACYAATEISFFENAKNEYMITPYNKMCDWFNENIKPKILSFEEYSKEKEEIKKEIPGIVEKLSKFFKDIKSKIFD